MKQFIEENFTGILGTIIFHLLLVIVLLALKINSIKQEEQTDIVINFQELEEDKEINPAEEHLEKIREKIAEDLAYEKRSNVAVNVSNRLVDEISTEKFMEEFKKSQNIQDYKAPDRWDNIEPVAAQRQDNRKSADERREFKGKTTITYFLENRWEKQLPVPVYKCQGGGQVILSIAVNRSGSVTSADVEEVNASAGDADCLVASAMESLQNTVFNTDFNAPASQKGTITYIFVAQ